MKFVSVFCLMLLRAACLAQTDTTGFRIDSLPADGLLLRTGWRWHVGDNPAWASPGVDDSRWDTIRPNRTIGRQPALQPTPQGWLRLTFWLNEAVSQLPMSARINQSGASELYIDGNLFQQLGQVGASYDQQEGYMPASNETYTMPRLSAGRHTLAIRLSQHRPPWYMPKQIYFNQSVCLISLFRTDQLTEGLITQLYLQALGNYLLVGIFSILSVIHFMYYQYRRKRINLVFGLTMLVGTGFLVLHELLGFVNKPYRIEWLILGQGMLISAFMLFLLMTYYVYSNRPVSWLFGVVTVLLATSQIATFYVEPSVPMSVFASVALLILFVDGIRISVVAMRSGQANARFMLSSIVVLVLILIGGGLVSYWVSSQYPVYSNYASAVTNLLFFLTLPISFAIILAREYAQTNRDLESRLAEVDQLSRDKERILTDQNATLEHQVDERTAELKSSLETLKSTQTQLIQREKMASLGELTAGIAHEIQNPLNFVNNFSEVSAELLDELEDEQQKPDRDTELEAELLGDLKQNLQKITQHGHRASNIVKGMLEHSRTSTGQRELTDLNALADEYLRLAYQGLRAKDKTFNADFKTNFDPDLGNANVVPQDIGRVLLNLYTNAFYALQQKQKTAPANYRPTVTVSTRLLRSNSPNSPERATPSAQSTGLGGMGGTDRVEIRVRDNGTGIPDAVKAKIFQPFFTTKPTGEGTGLGLSLSYDIVTKGHGGTLTVESAEGAGTEFIISLPVR